MATVMEYEVAVFGDNWKGSIIIGAQDAEEAIQKVRDIDLYNSHSVKVAYVEAFDEWLDEKKEFEKGEAE